VLLGADPLGDFPDDSLAEQAFIGARRVVAIDLFLTESARRATVVLPATGFAETDGTTTNIEGRVTQVVRRVTPPGTARSDWQLAVDLADRLGADLGFESLADIQAEMDELSAVHAGLTVAAAASDLDGVVLPLVSATVADPAEADADATGSESASASDSDSDSDSPAAEATAADATVADEPASDADAETAADVDDGLIPAPAPLAFVAPAPTTVPALDAYAARLVVGSTLYDAGTMVRHARSSAGLGPAASIRLHPLDHSQLGLGTSGRVRVINGARSTVLTAVADGSVARGTAVMIGGLEGGDDSALIDVTAAVTDVRLEVVS
jgi:anaerobic selenocysteine-containing dehydrogenase